MKRLVAIGMLAATLVAGAQTRDEAERMLKAARNAELVDGDLGAAITQYDAIIARFSKSDRAVTASALVRKAECLQKQGNAEARKIFEQVVRDYADQKEAVALATARLGGATAGPQPGQPAMRVVWTGRNVDNLATPSPDGRHLSFTDWDTGNLALRDLSTGVDRPLTSTGTLKSGGEAFAEGSVMSRDGTLVAYAWYDGSNGGYELRVVGVDERRNPPRVVRHEPAVWMNPSDWSPDGKWILANWADRNTAQLGLIGVQDGSVRILKSVAREGLEAGGLSPDGKHVVYRRWTTLSMTSGSSRAYIMSVDASSEVPLLADAGWVDSALWTPDGAHIAVVSNRSGSRGLWSVGVANGMPVGEPRLLMPDYPDSHAMGLSRDGSLFYAVSAHMRDIYVAGLDPATGKLTSEPRRVNQRAIGNSGGHVAWLPDGKAISFSNRKPADVLVVQPLDGGEVREIMGGKTGRPVHGYTGWFPDGINLMAVNRGSETWEFKRVDSRTWETLATWTVPAPPARYTRPAFSPDLMTMFFWRQDEAAPCAGGSCTYRMAARNLQTARDRDLFSVRSSSISSMRPSISPDGREMAFIARDGQSVAIMVAPTAGGPPHEIWRTTREFVSTATGWTRDGGHVLAFGDLTTGGELWAFPTKGGSPGTSALRVRLAGGEMFAVSPDGTQIAFVGGTSKLEVWVMTGLFPDAKNSRR